MSEYTPKVGDRVRIAKPYGGTYGGKEGVVTEVSKETGTVFVKLDGIAILRDRGGAGAFHPSVVERVAAYTPQVGDRVRVVLEGAVTRVHRDYFEIGAGVDANAITFDAKHVVSVEKIEPTVEVFGPGDVVRDMGDHIKGQVLVLGARGYLNLTLGGGFHEYEKNRSQAGITSEKYELVNRL